MWNFLQYNKLLELCKVDKYTHKVCVEINKYDKHLTNIYV